MGCINILTLLPLEIPNCSIPMFSPNSKIVNPPLPFRISDLFSDPLEFLFDCIKLQMNRKIMCAFLSSKKTLLAVFSQANKQLKFVNI